jgi:cytoskeletal protein RodZ
LTESAEQAATSAERLAAFGRWLTRERELRGLARDQVVRAMKLAPGVIEALESGEEGRMPPRAYAVGYLRAYAAAVGLDADEVVLRFEEAAGPAAAAARGRRRAPSPRTVAALVLACAAAAGVLWALLRS